MKVGTDAILLGSWAEATEPSAILDIGTGTGVIALMLAQRFPAARIDAVEIDAAAIDQATDNFGRSPWADRLAAHSGSIQDFDVDHRYDLIVSNPPYFVNSLPPGDASRQLARHDNSLTSTDLADAASRLLTTTGRFCVILPFEQSDKIIAIATARGMHCSRWCCVRPTPKHQPKRVLLEFTKTTDGPAEETELTIEIRRHEYSPEYAELAQAFLLKL